MGIRFYCPNGHRLNVKAFLAGKRGICPHCSARFRIPEESQIPGSAPKVRPVAMQLPVPAGATPGTITLEDDLPQPSGRPSTIKAPTLPDPFSDIGDAVWYVRPPSGGQYGPARSEVMRRWIDEGRVCPECLVWREGWSDWRLAGPVFPDLDSEDPPRVVPAPTSPRTPPPSDMSPWVTEITRSSRRASGVRRPIALVVVLAVLVIALLVILVQVLR